MLDAIRSWFDAILGRSAVPLAARSADIFALGNAVVELDARLGARSTGFAGLVFREVESTMFGRLEGEIQELVRLGAAATGTTVRQARDAFKYLWLLLEDDDIEDLIATMHLASSTLEEHDFGRTLLAAAFQFESSAGPFFLLYNFKRGHFYPFAPRAERTRDQVLEMRLKSLLGSVLPLEPDPGRWYPLWDVPGTATPRGALGA